MTSSISSWTVPIFGFVLGILIALSMLGSDATPAEAAIAFAFVAGYAIILKLLQTRSDVASLLSGMPRDERWALSLSAQVIAIALVGAFLIPRLGGADATPYAWLGALFAATYLGGILWYRQRS
jgi:hypothetical protein